MKGLYLIIRDLGQTGIDNKIKSQIRCFEDHGIPITIYSVQDKNIRFMKLLARLPFSNVMPEWKIDIDLSDYSFIYMRRPGYMSGAFLNFLRGIKKKYEGIKIIMEVPSYPYDKEYTSRASQVPFLIKDRHARKALKGLIDYITELGDEGEIFGIKTIKFYNGYDFSQVRIRKTKSTDVINVIAVARFCEWHGYERLLTGLYNYYKKDGDRKVHIHFVGDGPALEEYKERVKKYSLDDCTTFYGYISRDKISEVYDKSNIAVDVFGGYKKDMVLSCSLKTREYLAAGLPIVCGTAIDFQKYDELKKYILEFPNDNTPLDFDRIIAFFDEIYSGNKAEEIAEDIRGNGIKYMDYSNSLNNVIEVLNGQYV